MTQLNLNNIAEAWYRIQDKLDALKAEYDTRRQDLEAKQRVLGDAIMQAIREMGVDRLEAGGASWWLEEDAKPQVQDFELLAQWCAQDPERIMAVFNKSVSKTKINQLSEIPPGVSVHREVVLRRRKK